MSQINGNGSGAGSSTALVTESEVESPSTAVTAVTTTTTSTTTATAAAGNAKSKSKKRGHEEDVVAEGLGNVKLEEAKDRSGSAEKRARPTPHSHGPSLLSQQAPPDVHALGKGVNPSAVPMAAPIDSSSRMNVDSNSNLNRDMDVVDEGMLHGRSRGADGTPGEGGSGVREDGMRYGEGYGYGFPIEQDQNGNGSANAGNEKITVKIADLGNGGFPFFARRGAGV